MAADSAEKPAFAKAPKSAVASSISKPKALAIGNTVPIAYLTRSKDNADLLIPTASVPITRSASCEVRLNARIAAPAIVAASPKSAPTAVANARTYFCIAIIEPSPKPNLANSVWSWVTWLAVHSVARPNESAVSVSNPISLFCLPNIAAKFALACSKSLLIDTTDLNAFVNRVIAAVTAPIAATAKPCHEVNALPNFCNDGGSAESAF